MYSIDVCVDAKRCSEENLDKFIRETAHQLNCSNFYMIYETDSNKKKNNINCIFNVEYDTQYFDNMIDFLKIMKKTKYTHIECVYDNKIIYCSSYYCKEKLHKKQSASIKSKSKQKKLSKSDEQILKILKVN